MASLQRKLLEAIKKALRSGRGPDSPDEPYASVRSPIRRGPPDKSASVALQEPD